MKPRILFVDAYYPRFLKNFEQKHTQLDSLSYSSRLKLLNQQLFATFDSYPNTWKKLGHKTQQIIVNAPFLQKKWAEENNIKLSSIYDKIIPKIPLLRGKYRHQWETEVLLSQINKFKPDVIYMMDPVYLPANFLKKIKKSTKLLVGQIASPLSGKEQFEPFDLIISSLPNLVKTINQWGIKSEYVPLGFEPQVIKRIPQQKPKYNITFIGGLTKNHTSRIELLNTLGSQLKIDFFGYGMKFLRSDLPYLKYHGEVWGKEMYQKLMQSKITINNHIDVAQNYANNMRLFEATGCGTLLLTDQKQNLHQYFDVGKEVVDYHDLNNLIDQLKILLNNDKLRKNIALAGQKKTLKSHTYLQRIKKINSLIEELFKERF